MGNATLTTRRVRRTPLERVLLWERAYETSAADGMNSVSARGKTREASQAAALQSLLKIYGGGDADD